MSRMVSRSLSVADFPPTEAGGADTFLRFAVAITVILSRQAVSCAGDRRATPSFLRFFYTLASPNVRQVLLDEPRTQVNVDLDQR